MAVKAETTSTIHSVSSWYDFKDAVQYSQDGDIIVVHGEIDLGTDVKIGSSSKHLTIKRGSADSRIAFEYINEAVTNITFDGGGIASSYSWITSKYETTFTNCKFNDFGNSENYSSKVFKENGGFDAVIGNPPYGLLNKKQNQNESIKANEFELKCYKESDIYKPAKGGMINIFRLFICKSYDILRKDGHLSLIFPMAFMCDLSAAKLRKFVLNKNKIDYLEAFPERDNENKRVFKSAKMSVCILGSSKTLAKEDEQFPMRISTDRFVDLKSQKTMMSRKDIETIDSESLTIPLMTPDEYSILLKICEGSSRMSEYSKCYTGEIDLSLNKKYIHLEDTYARMLRGAQVQKFYTTDNISQGDILFLDSELYLKENKTPRSQHHLQSRIVMQGITGVNEKYRLKMSISKEGEYCANSVNYLMCGNYNLYFLGLLNSHLLNWYFAKLSTNSNVNGYEVDNIPVRIDEDNRKRIEEFVNKMLDNPNDYQSEDELNALVYDIYGLSAREREIVEQRYL